MPEIPQARVRVFLPTYRRNDLLPRALESLLAQSARDWTCELHNDDPADTFPAELVRRTGDPRVSLCQHTENLGAVQSFNLFYRATREPFYALLEDDNWWEPRFLEGMLDAMQRHPAATMGWCNQRIWVENPGGGWRDTGRFVNPTEPDGEPRLVPWGDHRQALGSLHSNGAMLIRSRAGESYSTPALPFAGIEAFRERLLPHPLLYVPAPLANFSVTLQSARSAGAAQWQAIQTLLLATYVRHARLDHAGRAALWGHYRGQHPAPTGTFLLAGLLYPECRPFLRMAGPAEWARFLAGLVRHPIGNLNAFRVRSRHPDWCENLDRITAKRFLEAERSAR